MLPYPYSVVEVDMTVLAITIINKER